MGLFKNFVSQTRRPEGFLGKIMLSGMNSGHAKLADWGFTYLPDMDPSKIIDLGCGGGRNAGELLKKYHGAHVTAVDYSDLSVKKAQEYNRAMIVSGRCEVVREDVSELSFWTVRSILLLLLRRSTSGPAWRKASRRSPEC